MERSPLYEDTRRRFKEESTAQDVVDIVAWLLTHYTDDGLLRAPQAKRRATVMIDGVRYWLVRARKQKQ